MKEKGQHRGKYFPNVFLSLPETAPTPGERIAAAGENLRRNGYHPLVDRPIIPPDGVMALGEMARRRPGTVFMVTVCSGEDGENRGIFLFQKIKEVKGRGGGERIVAARGKRLDTAEENPPSPLKYLICFCRKGDWFISGKEGKFTFDDSMVTLIDIYERERREKRFIPKT